MEKQTGPVLVVDDDEAVGRSLQFALECEGLDVRLYQCAADLLSDVALPRTGCLVLDYWMPDMDGLQLVGRLRERNIGLPANLITWRPSDDLHHCAEAARFRCVIEQPFEHDLLLDGVQYALAADARVMRADLRSPLGKISGVSGELWSWGHDAPLEGCRADCSRLEEYRARTGRVAIGEGGYVWPPCASRTHPRSPILGLPGIPSAPTVSGSSSAAWNRNASPASCASRPMSPLRPRWVACTRRLT